ncbi:MAG: hypothetical protein ACTSXX_11970 [Candidatus Baldrarchaeia archaeon]
MRKVTHKMIRKMLKIPESVGDAVDQEIAAYSHYDQADLEYIYHKYGTEGLKALITRFYFDILHKRARNLKWDGQILIGASQGAESCIDRIHEDIIEYRKKSTSWGLKDLLEWSRKKDLMLEKTIIETLESLKKLLPKIVNEILPLELIRNSNMLKEIKEIAKKKNTNVVTVSYMEYVIKDQLYIMTMLIMTRNPWDLSKEKIWKLLEHYNVSPEKIITIQAYVKNGKVVKAKFATPTENADIIRRYLRGFLPPIRKIRQLKRWYTFSWTI